MIENDELHILIFAPDFAFREILSGILKAQLGYKDEAAIANLSPILLRDPRVIPLTSHPSVAPVLFSPSQRGV